MIKCCSKTCLVPMRLTSDIEFGDFASSSMTFVPEAFHWSALNGRIDNHSHISLLSPYGLLHPTLSTIMTDLEPVNRVELPPGKASMEAGSEMPMTKMGESYSDIETSNSRIPAVKPEDKSREKVCGVCNDHEARYKCSRCQLP
jgi:hypothetical protein